MCPVCTVAVVGGLGLSRFLGVDDSISGLWIGAVILSFSFVFIKWLKKRFKLNKRWLSALIIIFMYSLTLYPLARLGGEKKLFTGIATGSLIFLIGIFADKKLRVKYGGQLFEYQKVVIPVILLLIGSAIAYFLVQ